MCQSAIVLNSEHIPLQEGGGAAEIKQIVGDHRKPIMTRAAW